MEGVMEMVESEYGRDGHARDLNLSVLAVSAFVAGAGLGAAAAFVTAPKSGRETRAYLKRQGKDLTRRGKELASDATARGRVLAHEQMQRVMAAIALSWQQAEDTMRMRMREAFQEAKSKSAATMR
jgi:gas vesicle protein